MEEGGSINATTKSFVEGGVPRRGESYVEIMRKEQVNVSEVVSGGKKCTTRWKH